MYVHAYVCYVNVEGHSKQKINIIHMYVRGRRAPWVVWNDKQQEIFSLTEQINVGNARRTRIKPLHMKPPTNPFGQRQILNMTNAIFADIKYKCHRTELSGE